MSSSAHPRLGPDRPSLISPIFHASGLDTKDRICAAFTGRGTSLGQNSRFSFHTPPKPDPVKQSETGSQPNPSSLHFTQNLQYLAAELGFKPESLTWPNGAWPHSGKVIIAEDVEWDVSPRTGGLVPVKIQGNERNAVVYDGIVTRSPRFVLGVQGADCPSIFMYAPGSGVIGLAHSGWRPLVRGVAGNMVHAMVGCGAQKSDITAYISPGAGDHYNQFHWGVEMEPHIRDVFVQAGREDLLQTSDLRHEMTEEDRQQLELALGKEVLPGASFKLTEFATSELQRYGVSSKNIIQNDDSTIVTRQSLPDAGADNMFRYHSYRREWPNHGLSMSVLFLKPGGRSEGET
ncbi:AP-3 complex subunit beta [Ophidiomyces ophidiicola]|nr:AP-3 complex subunit beta [Ophidiomyces ophidiicola]